jgi:hypothetical protein
MTGIEPAFSAWEKLQLDAGSRRCDQGKRRLERLVVDRRATNVQLRRFVFSEEALDSVGGFACVDSRIDHWCSSPWARRAVERPTLDEASEPYHQQRCSQPPR